VERMINTVEKIDGKKLSFLAKSDTRISSALKVNYPKHSSNGSRNFSRTTTIRSWNYFSISP
jgi:hypothetical protein